MQVTKTVFFETGNLYLSSYSDKPVYTKKTVCIGYQARNGNFYYDPDTCWFEYTLQIKGRIFRWKQKEDNTKQMEVIRKTFYPKEIGFFFTNKEIRKNWTAKPAGS